MKQLKLFEDETQKEEPELEIFDWAKEFPKCCDDNGKFTGFDVVIGNPPYISAVDMARNNLLKQYFKKNYPEATGAYDIYILFLLKALQILKQNGYYSWIIPNKFLAAQYAEKTLNLLKNAGLMSSVDISHIKVFSKANVYPIMIFGKNGNKEQFKQYKAETIEDLSTNNLIKYKELKQYLTFKEAGIKLMSGTTGFEAQKIKKLVTDKKNKNSIPFIVSGCIDKYSIDYNNVRFMGTVFSKAFINNNQKIASTKWNFWSNTKIVVAGMTKVIEAVYTETPLAIGVGSYGIYDFGDFHPKFLLALLNSSFMTNYVMNKFRNKHLAGGYLAINKNMIEKFPIIEVSASRQKPIIKLVDKILKIKEKDPNADTSKLEKQIDAQVYKIYGLTDDDIKIIENETNE